MIEDLSELDDAHPQVTNLNQVDTDSVSAELVRMHRSTAMEVRADEVEINKSAVFNVKTDRASAQESALGMARAGEVTMQNSILGMARAENADLRGVSGVIVGGNVTLDHAYAGIAAGRQVRGEKIESIVLLARHVEGDVQTVVDARGALIAGMVGGLFTGMMLLLGRVLFDRK